MIVRSEVEGLKLEAEGRPEELVNLGLLIKSDFIDVPKDQDGELWTPEEEAQNCCEEAAAPEQDEGDLLTNVARSLHFPSVQFDRQFDLHSIPFTWSVDVSIPQEPVESEHEDIEFYENQWEDIKANGSQGLSDLCDEVDWREIDQREKGGFVLNSTSNIVQLAIVYGFDSPGEFLDYIIEEGASTRNLKEESDEYLYESDEA